MVVKVQRKRNYKFLKSSDKNQNSLLLNSIMLNYSAITDIIV